MTDLTVTFEFADDELREQFIGWMFDGGGDQNFEDALQNKIWVEMLWDDDGNE